MGISVLIGLKATVLFLGFAYLKASGFTLLSIPSLYASLVAFLLSVASHPSINLPLLVGKCSDGFFSREPPYSEVCEGVYVGGWPCSLEKLPPGNPAIIDCTCELPRSLPTSQNAYLCVPTWDTRSPQPSQIESAVRWACRKRAQKSPVYIHCAYGHGRSVTVMCALLVALGVADDWKNAEKIIRERRPCIQMNSLHRQTLEEWSKHRLSSKKNEDGLDVSSVLTTQKVI